MNALDVNALDMLAISTVILRKSVNTGSLAFLWKYLVLQSSKHYMFCLVFTTDYKSYLKALLCPV